MTSHASPDDLLRGLQFHPLPAGWTPIDAIVMVKCIDADGRPTWAYRTTDSLSDEESLGALTVRRELQKQEIVSDFLATDED